MKITAIKQSNVLFIEDEKEQRFLTHFKNGECIVFEVKKNRNYQFHKKVFGLLNMVFENQDKYTNFEDFFVEVKLRTGHYKEHTTIKDTIMYIPKSVAFDEMDEVEFAQFFNKAIDFCLKHFAPNEEMQNRIMMFA